MSDIFKGANANTGIIHFTAESEAAIDWMTLTYQDTSISFSEGVEDIKAFEAAAAESSGTAATCTLTMNANYSVTANFR
jgi:deoxyxylulose-5-phosphate synthase